MADDHQRLKFTKRAELHFAGKYALQWLASLVMLAVLAVPFVATEARAAASDYSIEVDQAPPGKSAIILHIKNKKTNTLTSGATVTAYAVMGVTPTLPIQVQTIAHELGKGKEGRYVVGNEPGMKITRVVVDAQIPGESELVHGDVDVPDK